MQIEERGVPPYTVYTATGPVAVDGWKSLDPQVGYSGNDYRSAVRGVFDLTDAGNDLRIGDAHIKDSEGKIVFTVSDPEDLQTLHAIDEVTFFGVEFVNKTREDK